jgi:hypothetical protein
MELKGKRVVLRKVMRMPVSLRGVAAAVAFAAFQASTAALDASYAASGHPAEHATGQLAFDAARIEGYYASMQAAGTLGFTGTRRSWILGLLPA